MLRDRFGNEHAPGLPYARGKILTGTEDDFRAPALYADKFTKAALDHFGGDPTRHDAALFNRLTGATYATHLTLVKPGDVVVGVSASYSHPSVVRAAAQAGAKLVDTRGVDQFADALERESDVALVVLTRLAVTYEILAVREIEEIVGLAHGRGVP